MEALRSVNLGLGLFSLHGEALASAVKAALSAGCTLFDTAWKYGNEEELGANLPADAMVCTKISGEQYRGHKRFLYLDRQRVRKSVVCAARKLKRTPLDLVLLHSPFQGFEQAFAELWSVRREGLVKAIGVSGFGIKQLEAVKSRCGEYPQFCMLEVHPYHSSPEITAFCAENGIRVMARSPFAHGQILEDLGREAIMQKLVASTGKNVPQIVLRWCVQHGWIAVPRSADPSHICEDFAIFDF